MNQHPCELTIDDLQSINFELVDLDNGISAAIVGGSATLSREAEQGGAEPVKPQVPPMNTGIIFESGGFPPITVSIENGGLLHLHTFGIYEGGGFPRPRPRPRHH